MKDDKPEQEVDMFVVDTAAENTDESAATETRHATQESGAPATDAGEPAVTDEAVQEELGRLQQELDRLRELYLRKLADFENYRKRQDKEMAEFRRFANADLMHDCLPVIDNLERGLAAPVGNGEALHTGVELVLRQFKDILTRYGLVEVNPLGEPFDPALHEAIQRVDDVEVSENTVVQVLQRGYLLGERLIRPALVVVATPAGTPTHAPGDPESGGES
ncbi:MAG: nucleotide exchange factor GrpE [Acidobacteriota bacterium]